MKEQLKSVRSAVKQLKFVDIIGLYGQLYGKGDGEGEGEGQPRMKRS